MLCNSDSTFFSSAKGFLIKSTGFSFLQIQTVQHSSLANPSQTKWYAVEKDLFFNTDNGLVQLDNTELLSVYGYVGKSHIIPIILCLYCIPHMNSKHCLVSIKSDTKVIFLMLVCFLEFQYIGVFFKQTKNPVFCHLVTESPTQSESMKALVQ